MNQNEYDAMVNRILEYNKLYYQYKKTKRLLYLIEEMKDLEKKILILDRSAKKLRAQLFHLEKKSLNKQMALQIPLQTSNEDLYKTVYSRYKELKTKVNEYKK